MTYRHLKDSVWTYYRTHGRHMLPWRPPSLKLRRDKTAKNPYRILVSEIMLQQTQVDRVVPKYHSFIKKFPSFKALAQAPLREVLLEWKGLGYNRRGLNLKRLAEVVTNEYRGKLPNNRELLMKLPGIGPYTAGAVMTFVWNKPETFIETNIRTVFIHHFHSKATRRQGDKTISDAQLMPLIEKTVDTKNPREWYYALMDYGAHLKKTVGNVSKKSSTYTKQSPFKGSKRELRARVLHEVSLKSSSIANIAEQCGKKPHEIRPIVEELTQEGFICVNRNRVSIIV